MWKEMIICLVIVIIIIIGNVITQNYTIESVKELSDSLTELKTKLEEKEDNISDDNIKGKIQEIENNWKSRHERLAYYIEHDELEKVKTALTSAKSYIEVEEYLESIEAIDNCIYILDHIHEKEMFSLDNIL